MTPADALDRPQAPTTRSLERRTARGVRAAQTGLMVNLLLIVLKLTAGIVGNAFVLIADAVESSTDLFGGVVVWRALAIAARPADKDHPFGHGKAEPLATVIVSVMLLGAAIGITTVAIGEIRTPHKMPATWTLLVAGVVIAVKAGLARRVSKIGGEIGSTAVISDAWHHASDAISSGAAFIGIGIGVLGVRYVGGTGWEKADDWASLVAAAMIVINAVLMLRPAVNALMDRAPTGLVTTLISRAAHEVPGVLAVEDLRVRASGLDFLVDVHIQANPSLSLRDSHALSGHVKSAIRAAVPEVSGVLVHMEPHGGESPK